MSRKLSLVLLLTLPSFAQMATISTVVRQQFFDGSVPDALGVLCSFAAGTTTPQATYTDQTGGALNSNPISLDVNGNPVNGSSPVGIWLKPGLPYKFILYGASGANSSCPNSGVPIWTADNIHSPSGAAALSPLTDRAITAGKLDPTSVNTAQSPGEAGSPSVGHFSTSQVVNAGNYTNVSGNDYLLSEIGSCSPDTMFHNVQTVYYTAAASLCNIRPSYATVGAAYGIVATVENHGSARGGAAGGYLQSIATGDSALVEGLNILASANCAPSCTNTRIIGEEIDVGPGTNVASTTRPLIGLQITGGTGGGAIPRAGLASAISITPIGWSWHDGLNLGRGATDTYGVFLDGTAWSGTDSSQSLAFQSHALNRNFVTVLNNDSSGNLGIAFTGNKSLVVAGGVSAQNYQSTTNCAAAGTGESPSLVACGSAPAGAFSCATTASSGTCVVRTTAVTANSEIFITPTAAEGSRLSVTCNTTADTGLTAPRLAAKNAGTSFTVNLGSFSSNPECFDYFIVN